LRFRAEGEVKQRRGVSLEGEGGTLFMVMRC